MSLIRLHNVTMKYEDHLVLRSVFFKLQPGERMGLIDLTGNFCHDEQGNEGESHATQHNRRDVGRN